MGKRIRHLEFYGYVDQNVYMGIPNVDLSDIREVNREQDNEINAISSATKDKADLIVVNALSGKVDTFIDKQIKINNCFYKNQKNIIHELKRRDRRITETINEIVDDVNSINESVGSISSITDDINTKLEQHIEEASSFSADTKAELERLKNVKISKEKAYETFALKDDVYTKDEVDGIISGITSEYATEEWVEGKGYITTAEASETFATKDDVYTKGEVDETFATKDDVNSLNSDLSSYKEITDGNIETLSGKVSQNTSDIETISGNVSQNTSDIGRIDSEKADKTDLDALSNTVTDINESKANKSFVRERVIELTNYANSISGAVDDVRTDLEQERIDRENADIELSNGITSANTRIDNIVSDNVRRDERISGLRSDLEQEIEDRINGDNAIIGDEEDRATDNTIFGAKKHADNASYQAYVSANTYAHYECNRLANYVDSAETRLNEAIWKKADKTYVDSTKAEIETYINNEIQAESGRAESEESRIEGLIRDERSRAKKREKAISSALTHTSNIVAALTDWDGDDRVDYTDSGNGIVDVMHREIHDIKESISAITIIGEGIRTTNPHEVAFGTYNISTNSGDTDAGKSVFEIGIGEDDRNRKNAFEIRKNGDIYMWVEGEYMKINDLLGMLAHETY